MRFVLICLSVLLVVSSPLRAVADDVAVVAIAALTDPAKLATLKAERAANPCLLKCVYWLAEARGRRLPPSRVLLDAQRGRRHVERMAGVVENTLPHVEGMLSDSVLDRIDEIEKLGKVARRTYGLNEAPMVGVNVNILAFDL